MYIKFVAFFNNALVMILLTLLLICNSLLSYLDQNELTVTFKDRPPPSAITRKPIGPIIRKQFDLLIFNHFQANNGNNLSQKYRNIYIFHV